MIKTVPSKHVWEITLTFRSWFRWKGTPSSVCFKVVHHLGHFTVQRTIPPANVQSYHSNRGRRVNMRVQILETEYLPLQYQPLLLYSIFKRFGVCNQFTMSPVKTKNRHFSYEKESFDEHNHHYDAASVIKYGNLGFFASHFLPIPSLSDSFFFSYMDSSTNFCLETDY